MKKLFVLRLEGGLGNQLFQYAHARAMQLKYGGTLLFDTHAYNAKQIRSLSLHKLSIPETHHTKSLSLIAKLKFKWLQVKHKLWMSRWLKNPSSLQQEEYEELVKQGLYLQYQSTNFPSFIDPT